MKSARILTAVLVAAFSAALKADEGMAKHLFILSGQSNMAGMDPEVSFVPTVEKKFGKENTVIVKDAVGGQPIRRWYKKWEAKNDTEAKQIGDLYLRLIEKVKAEVEGQELASVTFVWMQGERDAREMNTERYAEALAGVLMQVSDDLHHDQINLVVGRLSDFDMKNEKYPHWTKMRELQVKLVKARDNSAWINTDDLNDGKNRKGKEIKDDLHYSVKGYKLLGERFAEAAIKLVNDAQ